MKPLTLIVCKDKNGIIGLNGKLPWYFHEDMRNFQRLTMEHIVIVGRKTWEKIPSAMPGRTKFIISGKQPTIPALPRTKWFDSLDFAITEAQKLDTEPFVIGGQSIYMQAMQRVTKIQMTTIDKVYKGDRWFEFPRDEFVRESFYMLGDLLFETWERRAV